MNGPEKNNDPERQAYAVVGVGASPKITSYRENQGEVGEPRSLDGLLAWARSKGVKVPAYARVLPVSPDDAELLFQGERVHARYFYLADEKPGTDRVYWNNPAEPLMSIVSQKLGVVGIMIDETIMENDEKFLHYLAHEVYELEQIKEHFDASGTNSLSVYQFAGLTAVSHYIAKNAHSDAWDYADSVLRRIRGEG